jgi:hypothetical protein
MNFVESLHNIYEKFAYHVVYKINDDGVIVKEIKNDKFSLKRLNTIFSIFLSITVFIFVLGLTSYELKKQSQEKLFLETFYVNQLCFKGEELSECYSISHQQAIKIFLDERDNIKTLFISGE